MKTKIEIIQETANFYNLNNRGMDGGACLYIDSKGNKCAVGRCLQENSFLLREDENKPIAQIFGTREELDSQLKEEYRGHGLGFWSNLQMLHDSSFNWDKNGLSEEGKSAVEQLVEKYTE